MTTQIILEELYRIYNALNAKYFSNELPPVFITIVSGKSRKKSFYGKFSPDSWAEARIEEKETEDSIENVIVPENPQHEISVSAEYFTRPISDLAGTLVHEMVHLYCYINKIQDTSNNGVYHNKRFKYEAEKTHAILIDYAPIIGYSPTQPSQELREFVEKELKVNEETFKWFRNTQLVATAKAPKKRYICPICGLQVQAKKDKEIICGECYRESKGEKIIVMDYWDITDADNPELLIDNNPGMERDED